MNSGTGYQPKETTSPLPILSADALYTLINELNDTTTRKNALLELSKRRDGIPDLAPMLWFSFGTVSSLLQEILSIYPSVFSPSLTAEEASPACNAIALFQCLASHPDTRCHFLAADLVLYLYPFINAGGKSKAYEYLRLGSLGVIVATIKSEDKGVINYLLQTEIIPLCLKIMENYMDLSKIVATFIMQKILLDDDGLLYTCETYDRFSHVARTLGLMVLHITREPVNKPAINLLRHIIRCFLRLAENPRAREALRKCIPEPLINGKLFFYLAENDPCRLWLYRLTRMLEASEREHNNK